MNRITRMLAISGLGLVAGVTIGAGPAIAATNTGQSAANNSASGVQVRAGDRLVGYFDTRFECERAGRIGERFGRWDQSDCFPVRHGFHHGGWALVVSWDNDGHGWPGHNHGWPGDNNGWPGHNHGWPGGDNGDDHGHDDGHHGNH